MRSADAALSQAKAHGRNGYRFYDPSQTEQAIARLDLLHELGMGIEQGQLELWYQPQVNLVSGRPVSVEALVRWRHPQRGLIYPNTFIPLAEESGLIVELGEWVLQESCRALAAWRKRGLELERIAINLSSAQLDQPDLVSRVEQVLRDFGTTASMLELELTESFLMRDMERARGVTERLSALGVNLAVDDFGTGYSSLAHLKRLSVDRLKIDKGFVSDLPQGLEAAAIVRAVIALAHNLRQEVIAEGVETEAQLDFLARQGCDAIQGYLYSRPLPASALEQLLASDLRLPAAVT
jgi:EAL domain-containing protein (putative c-di-GMP-specific phosphodiesterase class I)